jgi:hypothetical protein
MKFAAALGNRVVPVLVAFRISFITLRNHGVFTRSNLKNYLNFSGTTK